MTTEQTPQPISTYTELRRSPLFGLPITMMHYVINAETVSEQALLFAVTAKSVALTQVRSMAVTQSRFQKLFRLYTVHVATADPAVSEFVVRNIHNGEQFAAALQKATDVALSLRQTVTE